MDDWLKIKHMFEYDDSRIPMDEIEKAKDLQNKGVLIKSEILGGFDILRELMGEENCCIAFYDLLRDRTRAFGDFQTSYD